MYYYVEEVDDIERPDEPRDKWGFLEEESREDWVERYYRELGGEGGTA